jgi:hypothetical protein
VSAYSPSYWLIAMSVEFIGMIGTQYASEIHAPKEPALDLDYVRDFVVAHEQAGFDRILVGYFSNGPDGFVVASYATLVSPRLGLMLAHRRGFVAPSLAARKLATLDHFSSVDSLLISSQAATTSISARTAIFCRTTIATRAPMSTSESFVGSGQRTAHRPFG